MAGPAQDRKLQLIDGKRRVPAKPLPVIRDTVLRELEQAGGDVRVIGDGHKVSRRDAMRFVLYAMAWHVNRFALRVDGYGRPLGIGPQSESAAKMVRRGAA